MHSLLRSVFAIIVAVLAAAIIAFSINVIGHYIIPPPEAIDTNDFESIKNNFHLFQWQHFIFPLLAHAVGTFVASYLISSLVAKHKMWFALALGIIFTLASLSLSWRIGHFNWIGIVEIAQYIPISILGFKVWQLTNSNKKMIT